MSPMLQSRCLHAVIAASACLMSLTACDRSRSAEERIASAEHRLAEGDEFGAIVELKGVLSSDAGNVRARLLLAEYSLRLDDVQGARNEIEQAVAAGATAAQTALISARVQLELREYDELLRNLGGNQLPLAVSDQKTYRGLALLGKQELGPATEEFKAALSLDPKAPHARIGLARALAMQGQTDAALAELEQQIKFDPRDANALLLSGMLAAQRGDLQIAERAFTAARNSAVGQLTQSQTTALLGALAETQLGLGNIQGARLIHADLMKRAPDATQTGVIAARTALLEKNFSLAISEAQKALVTAQNAPQLKLLLGAAFLANGDLSQADAEVSDLLQRVPGNAPARKLKAQIDAQRKSSNPSSIAGRMATAQGAMSKGDRPAAIKELEDIRRADARAIEPRLALGTLYLQGKQTADADTVLREAIAAAGSSPGINIAVGRIYLESAMQTKALAHFKLAAEASPTDPEPQLILARTYAAKGDIAAARLYAQKALAAEPEFIPAAATLIGLDLREGKQAQAQARVAELRKRHPQDANVLLQQGDVAMASSAYADAAAAYEESYKRTPNATSAMRNYTARSRANLSDRTRLLEDWLRREPGDDATRFALATALTESGALERAIGHYELLARSPQVSAVVLNNLAWLYLESKDARAEAMAKRAFDLAPHNSQIVDTYGWVLLEQGNTELALPLLKQAASAADAAPAVRYHYAAALARSGQRAEAKQRLQQLVNISGPESVDARKLLNDLGG